MRANVLPLLLTGLAGVALTALALHGADRRELRRFAIVNGVAMLLLAWAAAESTTLVIERGPQQLNVTMGSVQLSASLPPTTISRGAADRLAVSIGGVDARPFVAAWVFDELPRLRSFGYWLAGGMREAIGPGRLVGPDGADIVTPMPYALQPDDSTDPPLMSSLPEGWATARADDGSFLLVSPPIAPRSSASRYRSRGPRPAWWSRLGSPSPGRPWTWSSRRTGGSSRS